MSTKLELSLPSMPTNGNHSNTNSELQHLLLTIRELQEKLLAEQEVNNTLQRERDDFVTMTESLSVQLQSAQTQIDILSEETQIDKKQLNELQETIDSQKQIQNDTNIVIDIIKRDKTEPTDNNEDIEDTKIDENISKQQQQEQIAEIEILQKQLNEKEEKIETLCNSLDNMDRLKIENNKLETEIVKLQELTQDDLSNQMNELKKYQTENYQLFDVNLSLTQERDQLINQLNNNDDNDNKKDIDKSDNDIHHAQYMEYNTDNTDNIPITQIFKLFNKRRGSTASLRSTTSNMSPKMYLANFMSDNNFDFDIVHDVEDGHEAKRSNSSDPQYYSNYNSNVEQELYEDNNIRNLNKDELKTIINRYKLELQLINDEKDKLAMQLIQFTEQNARQSQFMSKARKSDSDDGYEEDEDIDEEKKEGNGYNIENEYDRIIKHESHDSDIDNDIEETVSVCDYTLVQRTNGLNNNNNDNNNNNNDTQSDLDDEERMIRRNKIDCSVRMNALLILKKLFSNLPL